MREPIEFAVLRANGTFNITPALALRLADVAQQQRRRADAIRLINLAHKMLSQDLSHDTQRGSQNSGGQQTRLIHCFADDAARGVNVKPSLTCIAVTLQVSHKPRPEPSSLPPTRAFLDAQQVLGGELGHDVIGCREMRPAFVPKCKRLSLQGVRFAGRRLLVEFCQFRTVDNS